MYVAHVYSLSHLGGADVQQMLYTDKKTVGSRDTVYRPEPSVLSEAHTHV